MLTTDLEGVPTGGEGLAELRREWERRRELWSRIRAHERQARVHRQLADEHSEKASKYLTEVEAI